MSATISPCGRYRYTLGRSLGVFGSGAVLFVMLNPSTADAEADDPTIRRCMGFARAWGFNRLLVGNLYAYRATLPADLRRVEDAIGPDNDRHLQELCGEVRKIICAWGANADRDRAGRVRTMLGLNHDLHHLGLTREGQPKHPLYLRADTEPQAWHLNQQPDPTSAKGE